MSKLNARYDKTIVLEEDEQVKAVIVFNEKLHVPIFYGVDKFGMDDILELFGGNPSMLPPTPETVTLHNPAGRIGEKT